MKKVFNLSVILAVLMAAFSFTSCGSDDDDATISISVDNDGKFNSGAAVTGAVTAEEKIATISLTMADADGDYSTNGLVSANATLLEKAAGETSYSFRIEGLSDGKYKLTVTDKNANIAEKSFTVGETFTLTIGGSEASAGSFISISNQKVYNKSQVETASNAKAVEIVFDGTTFKSATESDNSNISSNGNSATITMNGNGCKFTTSTGYEGTIIATDDLGDATKDYIVTVTKTAVTE